MGLAPTDITISELRVAVIGLNGAGKSTLMSVLFGLYQPEAGEIKKNGKVVKINNPNDATALGIGMVHQTSCSPRSYRGGKRRSSAASGARRSFDRKKAEAQAGRHDRRV